FPLARAGPDSADRTPHGLRFSLASLINRGQLISFLTFSSSIQIGGFAEQICWFPGTCDSIETGKARTRARSGVGVGRKVDYNSRKRFRCRNQSPMPVILIWPTKPSRAIPDTRTS